MEKRDNDMELQEDKLRTEALFNKAVLDQWDSSNKAVPHNYFNGFEAKTLHTVQSIEPKAKIISLSTWKMIAVAASFFAITTSTYWWMEQNASNNNSTTVLNIQQIPTEEIDAYIDANDWLADVDWQTELNNEEINISSLNTAIKNDSN
jgi:hypothetical protein